jgi:FkbM family methyltransferase
LIIPIEQAVGRYGLELGVVLHLGAHLGEEAGEYHRAGARQVFWVEADPAVIDRLAAAVQPYGDVAIQALIADRDDEDVSFFVASNDGKSSSMLEMLTHREAHPDVSVVGQKTLRTTTVDTLCDRVGIRGVTLVTMDLQGAELLAVRGASSTLATARYVYTEVNVDELYVGAATIESLDQALAGFVRQETALTPHGWGDALYIRADLAPADVAPRTWRA